MNTGEFEKFINNIIADAKDDSDTWGYMFGVVENDIPSKIEEAKKEFPWTELNFFDPRDTEEAEDFRKHVYDWFVKWFGKVEAEPQ